MRTSNVTTIRAPLPIIFNTASDLARWPDFLSHYRYNRFLSPMPWGGIVKMSAVRTIIPTTWISEYRIDPEKRQLYFRHLRAAFNATRGMIVVWNCRAGGSVTRTSTSGAMPLPVLVTVIT